MPTLIADYEAERALFNALLRADAPERILLFRGRSGIGKTKLLSACREAAPAFVRLVPFQFKNMVVSSAEIFYRTGDMLGWEHFPLFMEAVERLEGPRAVQVDSNRLFGINQKIEVVLTGEKVADQDQRLAELTRAWFGDLRQLPYDVLFIFDTFELAGTSVSQWLAGPFLTRAAAIPRVRVLIAGQEVPEEDNVEWGHCCRARELTGVREAAHWLPVVEALNRYIPHPNPLDFLAGICYAYAGRPDVILKFIEDLPERAAAL